jgi:hypothetical protein
MTTNTVTRTHSIGDLVVANPTFFPSLGGIVYQITKVPSNGREVNYIAKPKDNPLGRGIKARAEGMLPWTEGDSKYVPVAYVPYVPTPGPGVVVRVNGHRKIADGSVFVITGRTKHGVKMAALGGDNDLEWTGMPMDYLTVIPRENIVIG